MTISLATASLAVVRRRPAITHTTTSQSPRLTRSHRRRTHISIAASAVDESTQEDASSPPAPPTAEAMARRQRRRAGGRSEERRPRQPSSQAAPDASKTPLESLVVDETYPGTVLSIKEYGAFVSIGAQSDGLVHISQLADAFVDDVSSVVEVGQEVTVRLLAVDLDTKKIQLSMREQRDDDRPPQQRQSPAGPSGRESTPFRGRQSMSDNSGKAAASRWDDGPGGGADAPTQRKLGPKRGRGEERGQKMALRVGDKVKGKVSNVADFGAFITVAEGVDGLLHHSKIVVESGKQWEDVVPPGSDIVVFVTELKGGKVNLGLLDPNDKLAKSTEDSDDEFEGHGWNDMMAALHAAGVPVTAPSEAAEAEETDTIVEETAAQAAAAANAEAEAKAAAVAAAPVAVTEEVVEETVAVETPEETETVAVEAPVETETVAVVEAATAEVVEAPPPVETPSAVDVDAGSEGFAPAARADVDAGSEGFAPSARADVDAGAEGFAPAARASEPLTAASIGALKVADLKVALAERGLDTKGLKAELAARLSASLDVDDDAGTVTIAAVSAEEVTVSAKDVKALRQSTGAGMMDCKRALQVAEGDLAAATTALRQKGLASADKKSGRAACEGAVVSYVHAGSRIGVLLEVNCETDFVARGDAFKQLCSDLAMQVAACASVEYVSVDDVDPAFVEAERAIEMGKEDIASKPEAIRPKIVAGRIAKLVGERALLEQPFVKDSSKTVGTLVKETAALLGENVRVRRFVRFNLGEGLEKKESDFAKEVEEMGKSA